MRLDQQRQSIVQAKEAIQNYEAKIDTSLRRLARRDSQP